MGEPDGLAERLLELRFRELDLGAEDAPGDGTDEEVGKGSFRRLRRGEMELSPGAKAKFERFSRPVKVGASTETSEHSFLILIRDPSSSWAGSIDTRFGSFNTRAYGVRPDMSKAKSLDVFGEECCYNRKLQLSN